ncbi:unnamed protein product [Microthlaspi erraticum]|uniref:Uncharacterized protein n=1 Tax=Microthlaspi erraticum TaxID=1685480 RepID=A0A6D2HPL8_9BRAS|nr:unnamed protein product [Microthlaspi erraticum]
MKPLLQVTIIKTPNSTRVSRNRMMKHTQTIFAKYCGRALSTIASSPVSSVVKGSWNNLDGLALSGAFLVGWFGHTWINIYHRRENWYRVDSLWKETDRRSDEVEAIALAIPDRTAGLKLNKNRDPTS